MQDNEDGDDDTQAFRDAMRDVKPLKKPDRISRQQVRKPVRAPRGAVVDSLPERFAASAPLVDCPTVLDFARSGIQPSALAKLRRGKLAIDSDLDLHGMTAEQARTALNGFLRESLELGYRCIRIVHGKGYRSPGNNPVIKPLLNRWLREAGEVLAFHSAQPKHGGSGALYVLLKRQRE